MIPNLNQQDYWTPEKLQELFDISPEDSLSLTERLAKSFSFLTTLKKPSPAMRKLHRAWCRVFHGDMFYKTSHVRDVVYRKTCIECGESFEFEAREM